MLQPRDAVVWSRNVHAVRNELLGERFFENAVNQRGLPRARDSRNRHKAAQRDFDRHRLQVVEASTVDGEPTFGKRPPLLRERDLLKAREEFSRDRLRGVPEIAHTALGGDVSALQSGDRANVHQVIGGLDGLLVMLNHQHGVAAIPQFFQCPDQLLVVVLVQADGRLIQDVKHPLESGPKL